MLVANDSLIGIHIMQLGLESICSIKSTYLNNEGAEEVIDPKRLLCSLCLCICFGSKQCKNKKCRKLFCDECYFKRKMNNYFQCPFCRMDCDVSIADAIILKTISSLQYYCNKSIECTNKYDVVDLYTNHKHLHTGNHSNNNTNKCNICVSILNINFRKCALCNSKSCYTVISYNPLQTIIKLNKSQHTCMICCVQCQAAFCMKCVANENNLYSNISGNNPLQEYICQYCNIQCFYCYSDEAHNYCHFCNKILCDKCQRKCEDCEYTHCKNESSCFLMKISSCTTCTDNYSRINYYTCKHKQILSCTLCFPKCALCKINLSITTCKRCSSAICTLTCSIKCAICREIMCNKCSLMCSICKKIICGSQACSIKCSNCLPNESIVSCIKCKTNTIRKCENKLCKKRLCLNCWNVCNYCGTILCNEHSLYCANCEESMCSLHFHFCHKCSTNVEEDSKYKKLCLKHCTLSCSFCENVTNALCKKEVHINDMVNSCNCLHNVCNSCIKRCYKCKKVVLMCMKCIVSYYFIHCKYCKSYLCNSCGKICPTCEEDYCDLEHKCLQCHRVMKGKCMWCFDKNRKTKCKECGVKLDQCSKCKEMFICSRKCYEEYYNLHNKKTKSHVLCAMFLCNKHSKNLK